MKKVLRAVMTLLVFLGILFASPASASVVYQSLGVGSGLQVSGSLVGQEVYASMEVESRADGTSQYTFNFDQTAGNPVGNRTMSPLSVDPPAFTPTRVVIGTDPAVGPSDILYMSIPGELGVWELDHWTTYGLNFILSGPWQPIVIVAGPPVPVGVSVEGEDAFGNLASAFSWPFPPGPFGGDLKGTTFGPGELATTQQQVPIPSTLSLMGLGLFFLATTLPRRARVRT